MTINLPQVASSSIFNIRHEHIRVVLTAASLLPTILKTKLAPTIYKERPVVF